MRYRLVRPTRTAVPAFEREEGQLSCLQHDRVFDAIEAQFVRSQIESELTLDGTQIELGSGGPLPLERIRRILLDTQTAGSVKDAIWRALTRLSQERGSDWRLAAIWMMIPGLRAASKRWWRKSSMELKEIEAEALVGFIEAIQKANPERERLGSFLWWETYRHLGRVVAQARREIPMDEIEFTARSHNDQDSSGNLLADAVHDGVLTIGDAELISRTRLEGERLGSVAQRLGLRYHACRQRRARAEGRLAGYVLLDGVDRPGGEDQTVGVRVPCRGTPVAATRARPGSEDAAA